MPTPDHRRDERDALQTAIARINRDPEQHALHSAATDIHDAKAVDNLRDLVRGDFARLENKERDINGKDVTDGEAAKKVLTPEQKVALFATLENCITSNRERYKDLQWATVKSALEAAEEKALATGEKSPLYGLAKMQENGHEVGITPELRDGKNGFRLDSCSASSPAGVRDIDYRKAEEIAEKEWGVPLMSPNVAKELMDAGIITEKGTWSHLKTDAETLEEGLSRFFRYSNVYESYAGRRSLDGGIRCSLWIPAVSA